MTTVLLVDDHALLRKGFRMVLQAEPDLDVVGEAVLKALRESGGYLPLGDKSDAAEIKARLGVSKNAFKQAIGRLYKQRLITLSPTGIRLVPGGDTPG